ncbi:MAG: glycoside hydrolase family 5 protein [Acidimicrobiales bacterium]
MDADVWLSTRGSRIETSSGTPVVLRGVGLGGWMNMENFITGYPSAESVQRWALFKVLGEDNYERFFSRFLDVFFTDEDAAFLASLGLNCVRLPVNYRHFEDDMAPFELKEDGFLLLDRAIERCAHHGLYSVIDLHALPGAQNQHWHSDNPTHWAAFWQHKHFQDRAVNLWEALARRYRDNPWVAGYNPVNEPGDARGTAIWPFYQRLHAAVRAIDSRHILFLDGNRYSTDFSVFEEVWPNTVYTCHDYALPGFADGGGYPGTSRGTYVDRDIVEKVFLERTRFMRDTGTPIWVGEFGPVYTGDAARDEERYRLLADQLAIYEAHRAGWSLWTYKDVGLQGLVYASPTSPYVERIKPVLEKKARLGVDAWGTTGAEVPGIMGPVEDTFSQEYPDFAPYPFGPASWVAVLVKHILLAEPMVDDFAQCFSGASGETLDAVAESFCLRSCTRRARLVEILEAACSRKPQSLSTA